MLEYDAELVLSVPTVVAKDLEVLFIDASNDLEKEWISVPNDDNGNDNAAEVLSGTTAGVVTASYKI